MIPTIQKSAAAGGRRRRKQVIPKKRKLDMPRNRNILDYSQIKLPALMFLKYVETYMPNFIIDCQR